MFKKKLLRRALPVLLSVAMVCQSAPVMSMAAEGDVAYVAEKAVEESKEEESTTVERNKEEESSSAERSREEESTTAEGNKEESSSADTIKEEESITAERSSEEENSFADKISEEETTTEDETSESDTTVTEDSSQEDNGETQEETTTEEETGEEKDSIVIKPSEYDVYTMPNEPVIELAETDFNKGFQTLFENNAQLVNDMGELEDSWDNREYFTEIKNQTPYGTCWAHAVMGLMEYSLKQQNIMDNPNLSEWHLASFVYNTGYDVLGNADKDTIECSLSTPRLYFGKGGNYWLAANRLMNWQGAASEDSYRYLDINSSNFKIDSVNAQDTVAILKDCYFIPTKNVVKGSDTNKKIQLRKQLKTLIKEYGGIMWSYNHNNSYMNDVMNGTERESTSYYSGTNLSGTNHAIAVVGWDDNYSRENFPKDCRPENDGAWIIRNSWGTSICKDGYMYMSYEEPTLGCSNAASVYVAGDKSDYDNNYFYNNVVSNSLVYQYGLSSIAAVYDAKKSNEQLKAVSFISASADVDYSIQIYKIDSDEAVTDPEKQGTSLLSEPVTGKVAFSGVYTVDINEEILLQKGDRFAIVITFPKNNGVIYKSQSKTVNGISVHDECAEGQMFINSGSGWSDCGKGSSPYSFNLNALTKNIKASDEEIRYYSVTFKDSDGTIIGDVQKIKKGGNAIPPTVPDLKGYTFKGWSGSYKNITSDAVLTAEYEPIEYTIIYKLNGGINAEENPDKYSIESEDIILSAPTREGYIFAGWYDNSDFGGEPVTEIAKGSIGNRTLYAKWEEEKISIELSEKEITLTKGETKSFDVIELPAGCKKTDLKWESSDENIVTVSDEGIVKAVKKGTSTIAVSVTDYLFRKATDECTVTVINPKYTVIFKDAQGNQIGDAQLVEEGASAIPPEAPECMNEGYTFKGWSGSCENITADTILTAEYMPVEYNITYVLSDGTNSTQNPSKYTIETDTFTLQPPTKEQAIFMGWYGNSDFSGDKIEKIEKGTKGNLVLYARWRSMQGLYMTDIEDQYYTGKAIQPKEFVVYDGVTELKKDIDYTVSYKNNINANTTDYETIEQAQNAKAPYIVIKGKGNYSGTVIKNFKILPANIEETVIDTVAVAYKADVGQTPNPVVTWKGKKLSLGKDYILEHEQNYSNSGTYEIKVQGKGNYTGEKSFTFIIADSGQKLISKVKKSKIPNQKYENAPVTITDNMLILQDGKYRLKEGTDYILEYDGTHAGKQEVLIIGMGKYTGVTRTSFNILGTDIKKAIVELNDNIVYNGKAQTPVPKITYNNKAVDYEILSYSNNVNAGTAKMSIKGTGSYSGTRILSFKIKPADVEEYSNIDIVGGTNQPYQKGGVRPKVIVTLGGITMKEGTDYNISYKNNTVYPSKEGRQPTIIVKGRKNFTGILELHFNIKKRDISELNEYGLMLLPDVEYNIASGKFYSKLQLLDVNGKELKSGVDYEKEIEYRDSQGNILTKKSAPAEGEIITVIVRGKNAYSGKIQSCYRIIPKKVSIAKAKFKPKTNFYYTGDIVKLTKDDIDLSLDNKPVAEYTIIPYPDNPQKGKLKFLLKGEGKYGGQKTVTIIVKSQDIKWSK